MKYYHVIYNSSQRTQNNGVGLGIRTYTQGTPSEYLEALKTAGLFSYSSGNMPQPNAQNLFKDGTLIEALPVSYCYAKLFVPTLGKDIFVISRTISVGFDYPYYLKNAVARLDNFVLDAYIFEEYPGEETMEIFYGNPSEGAVRFVPKSPVPSAENEEMKRLSVGHADLLPIEELSFRSKELQTIHAKSFDLLFAYIESRRLNQPLFVKCDPALAPLLMADLMRLLPNHLEADATFWANYQDEGWRDGFQIYFVNDSYRYDYQSQGGIYILDLSAGEIAQSIEAKSYKQEVIDLVASHDQVNLDKLLAWMLNPIYAKIREKSDAVKKVLYDYTIEPAAFQLSSIEKNTEELWPVLLDHFSSNNNNQDLFNCRLCSELTSQTSAEGLFHILRLCNNLISVGFQLNGVISACKTDITTKLLFSEEIFAASIKEFNGIIEIEKYFDKTVFEAKSYFLDNPMFASEWSNIYQLFCTDIERRPDNLIQRMFKDNIARPIRDEVIKKFGISQSELLLVLIESLNASCAGPAWEHIEDILKYQVQSGNLTLDARGAEAISIYILAPLSKEKDFGKWTSLMSLLQEKISSENIREICSWAYQLKKERYFRLILNKGVSFMDNSQLKKFAEEIHLSHIEISPEDLINKLRNHKDFIEISAAVLILNAIKKKEFLKTIKEGKYEEIEVQKLQEILVKAYGEESNSFWGKIKHRFFLPMIILLIALIIAVVCLVFADSESLRNENESEHALEITSLDSTLSTVVKDSISTIDVDDSFLE